MGVVILRLAHHEQRSGFLRFSLATPNPDFENYPGSCLPLSESLYSEASLMIIERNINVNDLFT